jgi:peptide/nickel transport system substrate-binding protein
MTNKSAGDESNPEGQRLPLPPPTRRKFLAGAAKVAGSVLVTGVAAACAPVATPPAPTPAPPANPTTAAATAAPVLATAPPAVPTQVTAAPTTKLVLAQSFSPRTLSPHVAGGPQEEINIAEQFIEKLVEWTPDATGFEPRLATEWSQINDNTMQLKLREGVKFTNGEDFNAESAKFSLETIQKAPGYAGFTGFWDGFDVVDSHTINVRTKFPTTLTLHSLAWSGYQFPPAYFQEMGADAFGTKPVGTGPFTFVEWVKDSHVTMAANGNYWGGIPALGTVTFRTIPEAASRIAGLETGELDFTINVPLDAVNRIQNDSNLQLYSLPSLRLFSLNFSILQNEAMKQPKVRQALRHAIDINAITQGLFNGRATPLNGQLLAPGFFGYDPDRKPIPHDLERAKTLLTEAGYPNGFEAVFKYSSGRYVQDKEVGQTLASQFAKVGVNLKQEVIEGGAFITQLQNEELNDMYLSGSLPPPHAYFMFLTRRTGTQYVYWSNPRFDELYDEAAETSDPAVALQTYKEILDLFDEDPPDAPLYQGSEFYGAKKNLTGFVPRAMQFLDVRAWNLT